MKTHKFATLLITACAALLLGGPARSGAAQAQTLGLSPAFIEAKMKRGATYTAAFTLTNGTNTRLRFRTSRGDYWYDEHNTRITGLPGTLPRSASNWVQFTPEEFIVEPQGSTTVHALITVPATANGSYYTSPIFEGEPAESPNSAQKDGAVTAAIAVRLRGLLMLTTDAGAEYNVEILNGGVNPPTATSALEMHLEVSNRGSAHARVRGLFAVLNASGILAGRGRFDEKILLPGQHDAVKTEWAGELGAGEYRAIVTLTYDRAGLEPATLVYELPFAVK